MKNPNKIIEILNNQLEALRKIRDESGYIEYDPLSDNQGLHQATQKLNRWEIRTSQVIKKYIDVEEENRFRRCANSMDLSVQIKQLDSYLQALINDIKDNPDFLNEYQSDDFIIDMLSNMHKEVTKIAKDRIQDEKGYRGIISDVCTALESYTKEKVNDHEIQNIGGAKLMEHVFSKDKAIIKLSDKQEEQKGFMFLFSGAIKAVRNKCTHELYSIDLHEVLDILGFLSFLFRTVDKGKVKK